MIYLIADSTRSGGRLFPQYTRNGVVPGAIHYCPRSPNLHLILAHEIGHVVTLRGRYPESLGDYAAGNREAMLRDELSAWEWALPRLGQLTRAERAFVRVCIKSYAKGVSLSPALRTRVKALC